MGKRGPKSILARQGGKAEPLDLKGVREVLKEMDSKGVVAYLMPANALDCGEKSKERSVIVVVCGTSQKPNS